MNPWRYSLPLRVSTKMGCPSSTIAATPAPTTPGEGKVACWEEDKENDVQAT